MISCDLAATIISWPLPADSGMVGGRKRSPSCSGQSVITEYGLSLRGVKDADRTAYENQAPSQLIFPSALGLPGSPSGQRQSLGKAGPEPGLGAGVCIVAYSDEPQDTGKVLLHHLVFDRNQSLLLDTWRQAESKLGLEVTFLAL